MNGEERNEVSNHEAIVYSALRSNQHRWLSNGEIAEMAPGVANRTIRAHTLKLVKLGVIDQAELFPGHRFRWSSMGEKRNRAYTLRLNQAIDIFEIVASERQ